MCVIVDANRVVMLTKGDSRMGPIRDALTAGTLSLVAGGELRREYLKMKTHLAFFSELTRKGSLRFSDDNVVDAKSDEIATTGLCQSNDHHIVALASITGARVICTDDKALQVDFTNPKVLQPKGRIYKDETHRHLLRKCRPAAPKGKA